MEWRIGDVMVTRIVKLEMTSGQPLHPAAAHL
jgi:hypothetical protein